MPIGANAFTLLETNTHCYKTYQHKKQDTWTKMNYDFTIGKNVVFICDEWTKYLDQRIFCFELCMLSRKFHIVIFLHSLALARHSFASLLLPSTLHPFHSTLCPGTLTCIDYITELSCFQD